MAQRALARVNLAAIERNVVGLRAGLAPAALKLCAVVKADASGHGAVQVGTCRRCPPAPRARRSRPRARPSSSETPRVSGAGCSCSARSVPRSCRSRSAARAELTAWTERFVSEVLTSAREGRGRDPRQVGHRNGASGDAAAASEAPPSPGPCLSAGAPQLELAGAMTHFATADGDLGFMAAQLGRVCSRSRCRCGVGRRGSWSTRPTAPRPSATLRPISTWSGVGSRSTVVTR